MAARVCILPTMLQNSQLFCYRVLPESEPSPGNCEAYASRFSGILEL